ncbi:MAG: phosphatase PAP2 family protein [Deltaproteobacteria bacterium]|nr:phosphatase PAP2 family protein [Deltaproteobacteria bacterium]
MTISNETALPYDQGFHIEETATIIMIALLLALIILFAHPVEFVDLLVLNLCCIALIIFVRAVALRVKRDFFTVFRDWFALLFLIIIYMEHSTLIPRINPHDVDDLLIGADRFLFAGHDPTVLMERFTHPVLTEFLQIVYTSYYFLPAVLCFWLYAKGDKSAFHISASALLIGFYISYIGYYASPAIGPRFTLDHLQIMPLDGVLTFHFLRNALDQMEGITRDCYPSGHAMISFITVLLARRYLKSYAVAALVWTLLLLISAIYLRYHYVVDVIVGIALSFVVYGFVPLIEKYVTRGRSGRVAQAAALPGGAALP